jgi:regulator of sigma E protease
MDLGTLFHLATTIVVILVMICILVAAHEYGHYLFARLFGMGVEEFAIGFGRKPIWTYLRKSYEVERHPETTPPTQEQGYVYPVDGSAALQPEPIEQPTRSAVKLAVKETTDFTIRPWPLGGFVRIKGMVPEEDGSEIHVPGGFYSKAPWKRFIVLLAGPVFSVLAGALILFFLMVAVGEKKSSTTIKKVFEGGPASVAGLLPGDKILKIGDLTINTVHDATFALRDRAGQKTKVEYERSGVVKSLELTPRLEDKPSPVFDREGNFTGETRRQARMRAEWESINVPVPPQKAFVNAFSSPYFVVTELGRLITKPAQLKENVGGPIAIARATSDAVKIGPEAVIYLSAVLSISVGIFNLLPIPPLDGGQMLVAFAEMLRGGRRLSIRVQGFITAAGFAMVLMLFASVMMIDLGRLADGGNSEPAKGKPK